MSGHTSDSILRHHARHVARVNFRRIGCVLALAALVISPAAHASLFSGDTLDAVANALAWVVLFIAPAIAIAVFWMVHILPERIAEKNHHPQAHAIKTLCLLSLFFGGLLWPLAWLWAYTKPVLHKLAYGTDTVVHKTADDTPPSDAIESHEAAVVAEETIDTETNKSRRSASALIGAAH